MGWNNHSPRSARSPTDRASDKRDLSVFLVPVYPHATLTSKQALLVALFIAREGVQDDDAILIPRAAGTCMHNL